MNISYLLHVAIVAGFSWWFSRSIPSFLNKTESFKNKQRMNPLQRVTVLYRYDRVIDCIALLVVNITLLTFASGIPQIYGMIVSFLAIYIMRVDQMFRIIPNEAVLLILVLSLFRLTTSGPTLARFGESLLSILLVIGIFGLSMVFTKLMSGMFGVGAGDIKLAFALALGLSFHESIEFMFMIAIFLLVYILYGILTGSVKKHHTFPMGVQIMGGYLCLIMLPYASQIFEVIF